MEDQNKTGQNNLGAGPISSGLAPGPGEHLADPGLASIGAASAVARNEGAWQWPTSASMTGESNHGVQPQDRSAYYPEARTSTGSDRRSRGAMLAGTVVAGFLLQRLMQSSSYRKSRAQGMMSARGEQYGADATLDADRKYGLDTAYAPDATSQGQSDMATGSSSPSRFARLTERVKQAGGTARTRLQTTSTGARARLQDMSHLTRSQYHRAKGRVGTMKEEQPLLLGAIGMAVGAGLGAALAVTQRERALMGDMRDKVIDKAKETAAKQMQTVKASAQRFAEFSKQEAQRTKEELAATATQAVGQPAKSDQAGAKKSSASGKGMEMR